MYVKWETLKRPVNGIIVRAWNNLAFCIIALQCSSPSYFYTAAWFPPHLITYNISHFFTVSSFFKEVRACGKMAKWYKRVFSKMYDSPPSQTPASLLKATTAYKYGYALPKIPYACISFSFNNILGHFSLRAHINWPHSLNTCRTLLYRCTVIYLIQTTCYKNAWQCY